MKLTHYGSDPKNKHLSSADILEREANGLSCVFTIDRGVEELGVAVAGRKGDFKILYFKEKGIKPLVLNKTNGRIISNFHPDKSPFIEHYSGIVIELYVNLSVKQVSGGTGPGLRVRTKQPKLTPKALPTIPADRFDKAIEAIKAGTYTKEALLAKVSLTDDQKTQINAI